MKLGGYEIKLEKKVNFTGWQAAIISMIATKLSRSIYP
jgi:hypothetical protein